MMSLPAKHVFKQEGMPSKVHNCPDIPRDKV